MAHAIPEQAPAVRYGTHSARHRMDHLTLPLLQQEELTTILFYGISPTDASLASDNRSVAIFHCIQEQPGCTAPIVMNRSEVVATALRTTVLPTANNRTVTASTGE